MNPTELRQATQKRAGIGAAGVDGQSFRLLFPAALKWPEILGCIAGDDTIMCANRSVDDTLLVMEKIRKIVGEPNE